MQYDRETGQTTTRESRWGSAFRPTLSPDGKWLVYGTRYIDQTRLRIRNLATSEERMARRSRAARRPGVARDARRVSGHELHAGLEEPRRRRGTASCGRWTSRRSAPRRSRSRPTSCRRSAPRCAFEYPIADSATFIVKQIRDAVPSPGRQAARVRGARPAVRDGVSRRHAEAPHQLALR